MIFALSITGWIRYARLVRGITLSVKERDCVKAAQFCGASKIVIVLRHILQSIRELPLCSPYWPLIFWGTVSGTSGIRGND